MNSVAELRTGTAGSVAEEAPTAGVTPRRVLLIINGTDFGGTEMALFQVAVRLERRGHSVHVLSLKKKARVAERLEEAGIPVSSLEMAESTGPLDLVRGVWSLRRFLREHDCDVVHSFLPRANVLSRVANRLSGRRRAHLSSERSTDLNRSRWVSRLNRLTVRWTDTVLVIAPAVVRVLETRDRLPTEKMTVWENGIDLEAVDAAPPVDVGAELGLDQDALLFCTVGRLIPDKGYHYLIRAFGELAAAHSPAHLVIVGEGAEGERLRREADALGLTSRVHFPGYRKDVYGILKGIDVFVLSSLEEGVPVVALEAMACALPVIATTVGGVPDIVADGESGLLVPPEEDWSRRGEPGSEADGAGVHSLGKAMRRLAGNGELRRRLGSAGRERVERLYDLERIVPKLEGFYADCLGEG